ncbi:hypothetical protein BC342_29030 [Streptomyces olivaceus]|nr:hypothetical protein BC342_29030 [Streptomyces olivaceus]
MLSDRSFTRDVMGERARQAGQAPGGARSVNMDGRPHHELRALVSKAFTVRRIEAMTPRIQAWTDELIDAMEETGPPADLVARLAVPLPALAICELLGFPVEDRHVLSGWCERITRLGAGGPDPRAWRELSAYIARRVPVERAALRGGLAPEASILTRLVHAHDSEDALSMEELLSLTVVVLAGGLETTQTAIGAGIVRLFRNPDQLDKVRADPDLVVPAVEEILRCQPVIDVNRVQVATRAVRLGGQEIRAGIWCRCPSTRPTATRRSSPTANTATSRESRTRISRSATARTTAWGRPWHGSNSRRPSRRCCGVCRTCGRPYRWRASAGGAGT